MNIAIRVDAEPRLGSGHAVRCLTLANELAANGHPIDFLVRRMMPVLRENIIAAGHGLIEIDDVDEWIPPLGDEWESTRQTRDALSCLAAAPDAKWLICDHYGLGRGWERQVRASGRLVLAIDDLGRRHDADILLDQNYYAEPDKRYADGDAKDLLIGPRYALLRPEFAARRRDKAERGEILKRLLICMGGADAANLTSVVLDAVDIAALPDIELDVVVGAGHPALETLRHRCSQEGRRLHVQTGSMADLLAACDLAIGAGGTSTWERCALGVPTITLQIAENQRAVVREGARAGFIYAIAGQPCAQSLAAHLRCLAANPGLRTHIAQMSSALVDGLGAPRVAAAFRHENVRVRRAAARDSANLFAWRNAPEVRAVSRQSSPIAAASHKAWLADTLINPDRWLLIGEELDEAIGVVRFDRTGERSAEVSIYLVPGHEGGGLGGALLMAAEKWLSENVPEITQVTATVLGDNLPSKRMFVRCGYDVASTEFYKGISR